MSAVRYVTDRARREPVLVVALVQAMLVAGVAFGLDLTSEQTAAVLGLTGAALALVARAQVTPARGTSGAHEGDE